MSIRVVLSFSLLFLALACRRGSQNVAVDTTMVFAAAPAPRSSEAARVPSEHLIDATLRAYAEKRVSADSAAKVIVDYLDAGHSLNAAFGPELKSAIERESRKRERLSQ